MTSPRLINIDPTGNLLIISETPNKPTLFHFRVSSKILSLASPLFASLFSNPTAHANQYRVILRDDVPETLGALLEICHFRRTYPLPHAPLQGLYSLAVLSQKYAIAAPLVPWISIWAEPLHALDKLDFSQEYCLGKWLTVACVYNQGPLFQKITKQAIIASTAESLEVSKSWDSPFNDIIGLLDSTLELVISTLADLSPPSPEKIASERTDTLKKLVLRALTLLGRYQTTESICKQPTNSKQCDAILLGSVLKGLMSIGVYLPIPDTPNPDMTIVDLVDKIQDFQFMWDPAHGDACGEGIKDGLKEVMEGVQEILNELKGLDLKDFEDKAKVGQAKDLVLTAVGDLQDGSQQRQEREREQEEGNEVKNEDRGGAGIEVQDTNKGLADTAAADTESDRGSVVSVPAGVMPGFVETKETMEDFGPQESFGRRLNHATTIEVENRDGDSVGSVTESLSTDGKSMESEIGEIDVTNLSSTEKEDEAENGESQTSGESRDSLVQENDTKVIETKALSLEERKDVTGAAEQTVLERQKEQLSPTAKDFVPSFSHRTSSSERGPHYMPRSRKELTAALKPVPAQHVSARANAEAKGQVWETPGPGLVQKYQRGPRLPFHPEVTVGDVSDTDHTTEIKRLKDIFPQLDNKIIVEFLRQNSWNSQDAAAMLSSGGIPTEPLNKENGVLVTPSPSVPESPVLSLDEPVIYSHGSSDETVKPVRKSSSGDSTADTDTSQETADAPPKKPSKNFLRRKAANANSHLVVDDPVLSFANDNPRFWPAMDSAVVLRDVQLPENRQAIKTLLLTFPRIKADRGLIDVLYWAGWDTEKATRKLEEWGFVRGDSRSTSGGEKPKPKPKGRGRTKVKAKAKEEGGSK